MTILAERIVAFAIPKPSLPSGGVTSSQVGSSPVSVFITITGKSSPNTGKSVIKSSEETFSFLVELSSSESTVQPRNTPLPYT